MSTDVPIPEDEYLRREMNRMEAKFDAREAEFTEAIEIVKARLNRLQDGMLAQNHALEAKVAAVIGERDYAWKQLARLKKQLDNLGLHSASLADKNSKLRRVNDELHVQLEQLRQNHVDSREKAS